MGIVGTVLRRMSPFFAVKKDRIFRLMSTLKWKDIAISQEARSFDPAYFVIPLFAMGSPSQVFEYGWERTIFNAGFGAYVEVFGGEKGVLQNPIGKTGNHKRIKRVIINGAGEEGTFQG